MKKNTAFRLFMILSVAILFRFAFFERPEGLWNDEYISVYIASIENTGEFFKHIFTNCHTPLYYLWLKLWMFLFPSDDNSLVISSIIPSLFAVPVMFYVGKELKDDKTGLLAAFITAVSSFNIYFAQEVRLYSLIFLISALTVLYFLKILRVPNTKNSVIFVILQGILCSLHTLGILFCLLLTGAFLYKKKLNFEFNIKPSIIISTLFFIFLSPLLFTIAFSHSLSQFWSGFTFSKILFNITDYFSPYLLNIINAPDSFISRIYNGTGINYVFMIFGIIPSLIAVSAGYFAIKEKNERLNLLLAVSGVFFTFLVLFSIIGKMILITKYSSEIYPVLILAVSFGFLSVNFKKLKVFLLSLFVFLHLFYLIFSPNAVYKRQRTEGHKIVADILKNSGLKPTDFVLLTYYDIDKFERYISKDAFIFKSVNKYNFYYLIYDNPDTESVNKNGKYLYKERFKILPDEKTVTYFNYFFNYKMQTGDRLALVFLNTVSIYDKERLSSVVNDPKKYKNIPFIFLVFSSLKNNILYAAKESYELETIKEKGDWTVYIYKKK